MIVNVECTADLAATRAALEALGTISQPTSTERLLEVAEAPGGLSGAALIDAINTVSGVCSCVDPDDAVISRFQEILIQKNYTVMIRQSKGQDISAACGQLRAKSAIF